MNVINSGLIDGSPIVTSDGILPINFVTIGDQILTENGTFSSVTHINNNRLRGRIYKIIPYNSHTKQPIILSENSLVYIYKKDGAEFAKIPAKEVTCGDFVGIPRFKFNSTVNTIQLSDYIDASKIILNSSGYLKYNRSHKTTPNVLNSIKLSVEFGKILGYFLSEGHYSGGDISFSLHSDERMTLCEDIINCFRIVFDLDKYSIYNREHTNKLVLVFYNKIVGEFLSNFCGNKAKLKHINKLIFHFPTEVKESIITSLLYGDGHISDKSLDSSVEISLSNDKILRSVKLLLLEQEIVSTYDSFNRTGMIQNKWKYDMIVERLRIGQYNACDRLLTLMNKHHKFKENQLCSKTHVQKGVPKFNITDNYILFEVKSIINEYYDGTIYNLCTENNIGYCTENFLICNN